MQKLLHVLYFLYILNADKITRIQYGFNNVRLDEVDMNTCVKTNTA